MKKIKLVVLPFIMATGLSAFASCPDQLNVTVKCDALSDKKISFTEYSSKFTLHRENEGHTDNGRSAIPASWNPYCTYKGDMAYPLSLQVEGKKHVVDNSLELVDLMAGYSELDREELDKKVNHANTAVTKVYLEHTNTIFGVARKRYKVSMRHIGNLFNIGDTLDWTKFGILQSSATFVNEDANVIVGMTNTTGVDDNGRLMTTVSSEITEPFASNCKITLKKI
jgi:hypothetical protein